MAEGGTDKGALQGEQLLDVWEQAGHSAMVPGCWTPTYSSLCLTVYSPVPSRSPLLVHSFFPWGIRLAIDSMDSGAEMLGFQSWTVISYVIS